MTLLKDLNVAFDKKIARGSAYKFMWLDASIEKEYAKVFGYENENIIVILNPGKRKRFVSHEGAFTFPELSNFFKFY